MQLHENLGVVERKVLGALILLADETNTAKATMAEIADKIGYKVAGGAITYAIRGLERDNFLVRNPHQRHTYRLLI